MRWRRSGHVDPVSVGTDLAGVVCFLLLAKDVLEAVFSNKVVLFVNAI